MISLLARAGLQLWIFGFIVFFGAEVVHLEPELRVIAQLLYGLPLVAWAVVSVRRRPDRTDIAIMVALGLYVIVSLASRDRMGSLETLGLVATYALVFWLMRRVLESESLLATVATAVATSLAFSLALNAFLLVREKVEFFSVTGRLPTLEGLEVFPWETVNALPELVLLALAFVAWMPRGSVRVGLFGIVAAASIIVLPFSAGRAGYLGLAVALVALIALDRRPYAWFATRTVGTRRVLAGAAVVIVLVGGFVALRPFIGGLATSGRLDLYGASVAMFADRPLLGNGPSTYSWARLIASDEPTRLLAVRLTHDVPLQTLVDGGLVLAAGFIAIVVAWVRGAVRLGLPFARRASIAGLIGYAAAVTLDDFSFLPAFSAMVIALAAWSLPQVPQSPRQNITRWLPIATGCAALLIGLPFVFHADVARLAAADGRTAAVIGDWPRAAVSFTTATEHHAENGGYWLGLGQARAYLGDVEGARRAYGRALDASPGDPRAYGALGVMSPTDSERVLQLQRAADLTIGDPQYGYALGFELAAAGDDDGAAAAWGKIVTLQPDLFGILPYDVAGIDRSAVAQSAAEYTRTAERADPNAGPETRWDVALAQDELGDDAGLAWLAVDAARHGDVESARLLVEQAVDADPHGARSYQAAAAVAGFSCDVVATEEALADERATRHPYAEAPDAVAIRREFVYREAGLGGTQPPGAEPLPSSERWPWSLITERPDCAQ
ncbi:MAG: O-antigen ligase family protein [Chloroflexota bacterium]